MRDLINLGDLTDPAAPEANPALIDCRDWEHPRTLSHGEIDRQVDACARALVARGFRRGDRIAILSRNRAEVLVAYLAIMRAGFVAIPTNIKFPQETVAFVLNDAEVRFAFCDTVGRTLLPRQRSVVDFDATGSDRFANFLDPGPFETGRQSAALLWQLRASAARERRPLSSTLKSSTTRRDSSLSVAVHIQVMQAKRTLSIEVSMSVSTSAPDID